MFLIQWVIFIFITITFLFFSNGFNKFDEAMNANEQWTVYYVLKCIIKSKQIFYL